MAGQTNNSDIPICLAYDQTHYEPLVPDTEDDVQKTIQLKEAFIQGYYDKQISDIPILNEGCIEASTSYASVLKRGRGKSQDSATCFKVVNQKFQPSSKSQRSQSRFREAEKVLSGSSVWANVLVMESESTSKISGQSRVCKLELMKKGSPILVRLRGHGRKETTSS